MTAKSAHQLALFALLSLFAVGCCCRPSDSSAIKSDDNAEPLYQTDPAAFREQAAKQTLIDVFGVRLEPAKDDTLTDLMPQGSKPVALINPGFEFTYDNGKTPGANYWIVLINQDMPGTIQGGGKGQKSDPIRGWTAYGCAGVESGRANVFSTKPDGSTGYIVNHGTDYWLHQTVPGGLKPNTRYTLMVETYKRNDYQRAANTQEMILGLVDGEGNPLDADHARYHLDAANNHAGFSICLVTLTTSDRQQPGDLRVKLGMNAKGPVRLNFDNVKLWEQPVE